MELTEQLRVLEVAQGDPAKLALATVDLAYPMLPEAERGALKQSLEAAAIPHWCDEAILATLLELSQKECAARLALLGRLTVVEPFGARGDNAVNVHEATRLALRKAMAGDQKERFRTLSARVAALFANDLTPTGRIEWIYHLLCEDPDRGAAELEKMNREWDRTANTEDRYALASALSELEKTGLVEGRGRVWALLAILWVRLDRGEAAQLEKAAADAVRLARAAGDQSAEAGAQASVGDALQAQGFLAEAKVAFDEYQAISERLAAQDLTNKDWQGDLATAHNRVGGVLEAQGNLRDAQEAFGRSLEIFRNLVDREPSYLGWRRELAAAHSRIGSVLEQQGKLTEAQAAYTHYLTIAQQLVRQEPANVRWQEDLATAHMCVGDVLQAQGKLAEAQAAFKEYLTISRRLAKQDSSNSELQQALGSAHSRVGSVLQARGKKAKAHAEFEAALTINRWLVEQDSSNAGWQRGLAVGCVYLARLKFATGEHANALLLYEEATSIFGALAQKAPGFAVWAEEKETIELELALKRSLVSADEQ